MAQEWEESKNMHIICVAEGEGAAGCGSLGRLTEWMSVSADGGIEGK